jgi:hypothetical protein
MKKVRLQSVAKGKVRARGAAKGMMRTGVGIALRSALFVSACLGAATCNSDGGSQSSSEALPWQPLPPRSHEELPAFTEALSPPAYVSKVKNLLTGLPATDAEIQAVSADPQALGGLIDQWTARPEHRDKMLDFFRNAFQQNQVTIAGLQSSVGLVNGFHVNETAPYNIAAQLERSMMDSFALTVWRLISDDQPLTAALTTRRYMLNPPLMSLMSFIDELHVNDYGSVTDRFLLRTPGFSFTLDTTQNISVWDTLDPASPYYMRWTHPMSTGCRQPVLTYSSTQTNLGSPDNAVNLFNFLFGKMQGGCTTGTINRFKPQWTDADWNDWRMVTIEPADSARDTSPLFYDIPKLRGTFEMRLRVPRVGFFGTLAFQANWATNLANVARVTANQVLIVALGKSFDGTGNTVPIFDGTLDKDHATPGSSCYSCHQTLDPFRQFFRQSYSLYYRDQTDTSQKRLPAAFAFEGVQATGEGVGDLAGILAGHPRFATAWTQKLCNWANSAPCMESDPEFERIANAFRRSGHKWKVLVRELFSSPLITLAKNTRTSETRGISLSVTRRDHFCVALSNRLGIPDLCAISSAEASPYSTAVRRYAAFVPIDAYSRGFELGSLSTDPNAFFRIGTESVCILVADRVVDSGMQARYSSLHPQKALDDFVATVMALPPSDPRAAEARQILQEHYDLAQSSGANPSEALKSTFTLACASPASVVMGL